MKKKWYNIKYKDYVYGGCWYRSTWKNKEYLRSKDKAKNYMMYQDIYNCICQTKKMNIYYILEGVPQSQSCLLWPKPSCLLFSCLVCVFLPFPGVKSLRMIYLWHIHKLDVTSCKLDCWSLIHIMACRLFAANLLSQWWLLMSTNYPWVVISSCLLPGTL